MASPLLFQSCVLALGRMRTVAVGRQRGRGNQYPVFDFQSCQKGNNSLKSQSLSREEMISKFHKPSLTYQEQRPATEIKVLFRERELSVRKVSATKGSED